MQGDGGDDERIGELVGTSTRWPLAAALAQPWADVVLSGVATIDTLRSNLAALDVTWDAELDERLSTLAEPADECWEWRAELPWN
jgi:aryl-alcohol dehydrogenase-like predicted oxidoreductase